MISKVFLLFALVGICLARNSFTGNYTLTKYHYDHSCQQLEYASWVPRVAGDDTSGTEGESGATGDSNDDLILISACTKGIVVYNTRTIDIQAPIGYFLSVVYSANPGCTTDNTVATYAELRPLETTTTVYGQAPNKFMSCTPEFIYTTDDASPNTIIEFPNNQPMCDTKGYYGGYYYSCNAVNVPLAPNNTVMYNVTTTLTNTPKDPNPTPSHSSHSDLAKKIAAPIGVVVGLAVIAAVVAVVVKKYKARQEQNRPTLPHTMPAAAVAPDFVLHAN